MNTYKLAATILMLLGAIGMAITLTGMISAYGNAQVPQSSPGELARGINSSLRWSAVGAPLFVAGAIVLCVGWWRGRK